MPFTDDDLDSFLDTFEARTYSVRLSGVEVKTLRGIFRRATEFVGQADQILVLPSIRCKESDLDGVTRTHTLIDGVTGIEYKIHGDFVPANSGLSLVGLVKK